ncbi:MAG: hypothetical protein UW63_C0040G0009 [Candidatus Uhrbacteria bacterium GW2011_GWF2_44_350]|uniref:DUF218 domain-containing protein n=1 Tax=Candidatus Uhrbacteria bacterium GW2011_GWF2_44_350 TaxID=1619000 RepID=A0A0G1JF43_9BACT|nr:MAG: hypothetical protein UW63_C0040G0009 [Candidatus Uhrbacteria bacterium GW2011_GWF2_44_350]
MKEKVFSALVCGYGVPKNILNDKNYHTYLTQIFNFLFDRFANTSGTVVLSGGATDCFPPFKRTEAREMKKWFDQKIRIVQKETGQKIPWAFILDNKALSTVENILYFKPLAKNKIFIFAEKTRAERIKKISKKIFKNKVNYHRLRRWLVGWIRATLIESVGWLLVFWHIAVAGFAGGLLRESI